MASVETAAAAGESDQPLGLRVLLAEDNPVNVAVALAMLQTLGCEVRSVVSGAQALDALAQQAFDVVLMDREMPEMGGEAATRQIRERELAGSHLPVIAVTASTQPGDRELCLAAGMDDFLAKPYTQTDLRDVIKRWTGAVRSSAGLPAGRARSSR